MSYKNAESLLPEQLVREIQKYVQGEQIYIPRKPGEKLGWGSKNGTRVMIIQRNDKIRKQWESGVSIAKLAEMNNLSEDGIRKIIYKNLPFEG